VDAFCGCEVVTGVLDIGGRFNGLSDIDDIANLATIKGVGEYLYVWGTNLTTLSVFENTHIANNLGINSNSQLITIDAFNQLENLNTLFITSNSSLQQINGFQNLKEANVLTMALNASLTRLNGFSQLEELNGFTFQSNDSFQILDELADLKNINRRFEITNNDLLETTSFQPLNGVVETVFIMDNPLLKSLPAIGQLTINDFLTIRDNIALSDCCELVTLLDEDFNNGHNAGTLTLANNGNFCETKEAVLANCSDNEPCDTSICQGDVILQTQAEVDAFCGCTVIEGNLRIGKLIFDILSPSSLISSDVHSLANLHQLERVKGYVSILNTELSDLEGLNKLKQVGSNLALGGNKKLLSLEGLENLTTAEGIFSLTYSLLVDNLDALQNLTSIGTQIIIHDNTQLKSIKGLSSVQSNSYERIIIRDNPVLERLDGLEKLQFINGRPCCTSLLFQRNNSLINIDALQNIQLIKGTLSIKGNQRLMDCCPIVHLVDNNLENGKVDGTIFFEDNPQFCNSAAAILQNCQTPPPTCDNIQIQTQNNQIVIEGLTAPNEIVKVFDKDFNIVYQCVANCEETQMAGTFSVGNYTVDLQLYDENWVLICVEQRTVVLDNSTTNPCNGTNCETISPVLANIPADMTVECDAIPSEPTNVTATDNCDDNVEVQFEEVRLNRSCVDNYVLTRTWTATDNCGNSTQSIQVITVQDATPPVLTNLPADLTFNASDGFDTTFPTGVDNCDPNPTLTVEDAINSTETEIVRTFTTTDNCGNYATAQQIITIIQDGNNLCDALEITTTNNEISFKNIDAPNSIVKVFDANYQIIFDCTATCENELVVPVMGEGIYHTDVQFYDENWTFICKDRQDIEVIDDSEPCNTTICQGDVVLRTQVQVDAFCGCEIIDGRLDIGTQFADINSSDSSDIHDLSNLIGIREVRQTVNIKRTKLKNLRGLDSLEVIGKGFGVLINEEIISLAGLEKLKSVGGNTTSQDGFTISKNRKIEQLNNLRKIEYIGDWLIIDNNPKLQSIEGLSSSRTTTLDRIFIHDNESLINLNGLENIKYIKEVNFGVISILRNKNLENVNGLENIELIEKGFLISRNDKLADCCGIAHLLDEDPTNGVVLGVTQIQRNLGFCNAPTTILENCENNLEASCDFVEIITTVPLGISIQNLIAPIQIVKVFDANYATVFDCFGDCEETINLTDLAVGRYHININFYDENWQPICEKVETVEIEANTQDRNTQLLPADFALYPNPAELETFIDLGKLKGETVQLVLFNQFGQKISEQTVRKVAVQKERIDISTLQNGVYILQIKAAGKRPIAKKMIVNRLY